MSSIPTPPGWYQDPASAGMQRWWDGSRWTDQAQPHAPAGPTGFQGYGVPDASGYASPGYPMPGASAYQAPGYQNPGYQTPGYPVSGPSGYTPPPVPTMNFGGSSRRAGANHYSLITFGVCALYVVLANVLHFVLIGFIPLSFGLRARQRREPLAILALVAAAAVIVYSISLIA